MAIDFSRFANVLTSLRVTGEVRELPEPEPTAAAAAKQLGRDVGAAAVGRTPVRCASGPVMIRPASIPAIR
jgi:hypothetical protein